MNNGMATVLQQGKHFFELAACPVDVNRRADGNYSDKQSLQIWLWRRASSPQSTPSSCKAKPWRCGAACLPAPRRLSATSATSPTWKSQSGRDRKTSRPNISYHIFLSILKTAVSTPQKKSDASHGYKR